MRQDERMKEVCRCGHLGGKNSAYVMTSVRLQSLRKELKMKTKFKKEELKKKEELRWKYKRGGDPANPNPMPLKEQIKLFVEAHLPEIYHKGISDPKWDKSHHEGDVISYNLCSDHPLIEKRMREGVLEATSAGPAGKDCPGYGLVLWYRSGKKKEADEIVKSIAEDMKKIGYRWI